MQNENEKKKKKTHQSPNLEGWSRESTNPAPPPPPPRVVLALLLLLLKQDQRRGAIAWIDQRWQRTCQRSKGGLRDIYANELTRGNANVYVVLCKLLRPR